MENTIKSTPYKYGLFINILRALDAARYSAGGLSRDELLKGCGYCEIEEALERLQRADIILWDDRQRIYWLSADPAGITLLDLIRVSEETVTDCIIAGILDDIPVKEIIRLSERLSVQDRSEAREKGFKELSMRIAQRERTEEKVEQES